MCSGRTCWRTRYCRLAPCLSSAISPSKWWRWAAAASCCSASSAAPRAISTLPPSSRTATTSRPIRHRRHWPTLRSTHALGLPEDWLNAGPASLIDTGFPEGFASRVEVRHHAGLTLDVASRYDQVFLKLYAAADQSPGSKHADDLRRLRPTHDELAAAALDYPTRSV